MQRDHVDHLVEQWARERPDLDTAGLRLAARVVRLQRFLDHAAAAAVARFELQLGELNVLAALRRAGEPYALTPTELYRGLLISSGAMTNRLDRLEAEGLVVRDPDPQDRRRIRVVLTERGRDVIDAAMDAHTATLHDAFADLDEADRSHLEDLLRKVLVQLEADPDR